MFEPTNLFHWHQTPSQWRKIDFRCSLHQTASNKSCLVSSELCSVRFNLQNVKYREGEQRSRGTCGHSSFSQTRRKWQNWHENKKKSSDKMSPPVGIEPGPLITSNSKSSSFLSELISEACLQITFHWNCNRLKSQYYAVTTVCVMKHRRVGGGVYQVGGAFDFSQSLIESCSLLGFTVWCVLIRFFSYDIS